jgi:hypothetical protein
VTYARPDRAGAVAPRNVPAPRRRHTTFARLVGATGLVLLTSLLFWMLTDDAFSVTEESVRFEGLAHAEESAVRALLSDIERGPNIFRVRTSDIVAELSTLTEVDAASARVTLPADLTVRLDERDPVFIWSNGALSWLVDEEGMLFAPADEATAAAVRAAVDGEVTDEPIDVSAEDTGAGGDGDAETELDPVLEARAALPLVEDGRMPPEPPTVGTYLPASDLAVMRQLLALTPELLGSLAQDLHLRVDAADGYVLESRDRGWRALFGYYTPTLQPPEVIPRQVQCLQWLLASEERKLETVRLALSDETCGTFTKYG